MDEPNILRRRGLQVGHNAGRIMLFVTKRFLEFIQQLQFNIAIKTPAYSSSLFCKLGQRYLMLPSASRCLQMMLDKLCNSRISWIPRLQD